MNREIFLDWYTNEFIPLVKAKKMKTNDHVKYLPPNVTAIVQPMDQGVIGTVKKLHRKHLARRLLLDHEGRVEDFLKALTLNDCCYMISDAWEEITNSNLSKAWKVFFPHATIPDNDEDAANKVANQMQEAVIDTRLIFVQMPELNVSETEIISWIEEDHNLPGWEPLSDEAIIGMVEKNYTISSSPSKAEDQTESISRSHGACHILSAINDVAVWYEKHKNCRLEDQTVLAKIRNIYGKRKTFLL
ncbi:jerky protein homolog-like isoform X2 [Cephus cinctus]|uniref:Jerky protein homolog-like isoform X2 n=1 Tax=Cephus cinctus TaxID=211228 RepID=A0AAJ7RM94_CEPCN|nr:jerky protein homolog-like isoform X2 [Cephus cinctus]